MQVDLQFVSSLAAHLYGGKLERKHERDAGVDVRACIESTMTVPPGGRAKVPTGIKIALPFLPADLQALGLEVEAQIRPRSGYFNDFGISVGNAPGTVDASYTGEVCALIENRSNAAHVITPGERIAQLVVAPVFNCSFRPVEHLPTVATTRGDNGFGSTGTA